MNRMRAGLVAVVSMVVVGGGGYAWGAGGGSDTVAAQPARSVQSRVVAAAPIDTTTESTFTPITPCRAANTATRGGALKSHAARNFYLGGTVGFTTQGGRAGGCGIPLGATGVAVTVTALHATHNGTLKIWRTGDAEPGTLFMTYGTALNSSGAGTVRVSATGRSRIRNFGGPTQVVIDVTGYFNAPMYASVGTNGTLVLGSRVKNAFLIGATPSSYEVDFDRDVSHCAYSVTSYFNNYTLAVEPRTAVPDGVYVFSEFNGAATADQFYLTVTC